MDEIFLALYTFEALLKVIAYVIILNNQKRVLSLEELPI